MEMCAFCYEFVNNLNRHYQSHTFCVTCDKVVADIYSERCDSRWSWYELTPGKLVPVYVSKTKPSVPLIL